MVRPEIGGTEQARVNHIGVVLIFKVLKTDYFFGVNGFSWDRGFGTNFSCKLGSIIFGKLIFFILDVVDG